MTTPTHPPMTWYCTKCHKELGNFKYDEFCSECGSKSFTWEYSPNDDPKCKFCHTEEGRLDPGNFKNSPSPALPPHQKFCPECGRSREVAILGLQTWWKRAIEWLK